MMDHRVVAEEDRSRIRLFARWIAFTLGSVIAGAIVFIVIGIFVGEALDRYGGFVFGAVFALLFGSALGVGQWLAMRKVFDPGMGWIVVTVAGFLFGTLLIFGVLDAGSRETSLAEGILHAVLLGGGIGFAQWVILREKVMSAALWLPASMAAWIVAELLGRATTSVIGPPIDILVLLFSGGALQGLGFALLAASHWSPRTERQEPPHREGIMLNSEL